MLPQSVCALALCCLALLPAARGESILERIFKKPDMEIITVTDMTEEGRAHRPATPAEPVYYMAVSLGFQDIGGLVGGEKIPPKDDMLRNITKVLAAQGYLPATETTPPPTLLLVLAWGTLYVNEQFSFNLDVPPQQVNREQILKFIGGYKVGFSESDFDPLTPTLGGLTFKGYDAQSFYELASQDFYISVVTAYDYQAMAQQKKTKLWMTRIACPAKGYWLGDVMPTMMSVAGPHIGRETDKPVWVNASSRYRPQVKIGDMQLLEYLEKGVLPVIEAPATSLKKGKANPEKEKTR